MEDEPQQQEKKFVQNFNKIHPLGVVTFAVSPDFTSNEKSFGY